MYKPLYLQNDNNVDIRQIIHQNPLATLVSLGSDGQIFVSHIPLIVIKEAGKEVLVGHFAKFNPHVDFLKESPNIKVIFSGPSGYISPSWLKEKDIVPTWNYSVIHIEGVIEFVDEYLQSVEILKQLTAHFEKTISGNWSFEMPTDLLTEESLNKAICCFKIIPTEVNSKFKLSQNKSEDQRDRIVENLLKVDNYRAKELAELMLKKIICKSKASKKFLL